LSPSGVALIAVVAAQRSAPMSANGHEIAESACVEGELASQDVAQLLSVDEAAALIGCSGRTVRRYAARGYGFRLGDAWALRESDVLALKNAFEWRKRNGSRRFTGTDGVSGSMGLRQDAA
jgi:hypothetical protein